jgi:hypothetical protein
MTPGKKQRQATRRAAVKEVKEVPECLSEEKKGTSGKKKLSPSRPLC